jgi:SAM-dependent MidA family methyltransferase
VIAAPLLPRIIGRIEAEGPMRFDDYLESALYDPDGGFYTTTGGAGRGRDFLTSPEVGPLFGAVLARAVDTWWDEAGRPDRWTVVDAGAGPGALLRSLLSAGPACAEVLRPVAVDRSGAQRAHHPEAVQSSPDLPERPIVGVVLANELLDNVPWRLLERATHGWAEVLVDTGRDGALVETTGPVDGRTAERASMLAPSVEPGARIPVQDRAAGWLTDVLDRVRAGRVVVFDYGATTVELASRPQHEWLRTHRGHRWGSDPLAGPGTQDVTVDVATDQLARVRRPDEHRTQADFLRVHGLEDLVAEGRRIWTERAHLGDLKAMKARSRVGEAEALTDPAGLGAFQVLEWQART